MRKFANMQRIEERVTAQKLGLTVEQLRAKVAAGLKRQAEIDKAWALAHKEEREAERRVKETWKKKKKPPVPVAEKKPVIKPPRADGIKQYWNGSEWVKLDEKEKS